MSTQVRSPQYRLIEQRFGMSVREVLTILLSNMTRDRAAEVLGINPNTLDRYLAANGLTIEPLRANIVKEIGGEVVPVPSVEVQQNILNLATA